MKLVLGKIFSTAIDSIKRRIAKFQLFGLYDFRTAYVSAPYGIDSNPIKNMIAVYGETEEKGKAVIIGYINKNAKALEGELRFFSTNANGEEKFFVWLKNDGTCQIGGSTDNMVRYTPLNAALQSEVTKINIELGKISTAISALGGAYVVAPVTIDITGSKINEVKTSS